MAAAGLHVAASGAHLRESLLFAGFFAAATVWQVGVAVAFVRRPGRGQFLRAAGGNALLIGLWAISRTTGLPFGPSAGSPEATGAIDLLATLLEAGIVVGSLVLLSRPDAVPASRAVVAGSAMRTAIMLSVATSAALVVGSHGEEAFRAVHGHALHLALIGAAAVLFSLHLLLHVWVNGPLRFAWRLGPVEDPGSAGR